MASVIKIKRFNNIQLSLKNKLILATDFFCENTQGIKNTTTSLSGQTCQTKAMTDRQEIDFKT